MKKFIRKYRCFKHKRYVSSRMAELTSELCNDAIHTGIVDLEKRKQLLKYQAHYKYYENGGK